MIEVVVDSPPGSAVHRRSIVPGGCHEGEFQIMIHHFEHSVLLDVRQQQSRSRLAHVDGAGATGAVTLTGMGQLEVVIVVVMDADADLLQVAGAAHAIGGGSHFLDRRQQERDQQDDDRNHHQQFDQGEAFYEADAVKLA
jgi:hypothetical protein